VPAAKSANGNKDAKAKVKTRFMGVENVTDYLYPEYGATIPRYYAGWVFSGWTLPVVAGWRLAPVSLVCFGYGAPRLNISHG
jgi:hypothetical protein